MIIEEEDFHLEDAEYKILNSRKITRKLETLISGYLAKRLRPSNTFGKCSLSLGQRCRFHGP